MGLKEQLLELQHNQVKNAPPEVMELFLKANEDIYHLNTTEHALDVGATASDFTLYDTLGHERSLQDLMGPKGLIINFYRGSWCPYCNLELMALQQHLKTFQDSGFELIAISIEKPDQSLSIVEKNKLEFTVLSDPELQAIRDFGLTFKIPDSLQNLMQMGFESNIIYGPEIAIPATYVLSKDRKVLGRFVDLDASKRLDPQDIFNML